MVTVRPVTPESIAPGRFVDNGDGTITDSFTELVWHQDPLDFGDSNGLMQWWVALREAEASELNQLLDWRLPNVFELGTLADYSATSTPAMDPLFGAFSNEQCPPFGFPLEGCAVPYRTSTTAEHRNKAFAFFPNSATNPNCTSMAAGALRDDNAEGTGHPDYGSKFSFLWVLPVRGPN